jgi:hypothetical protein
MDGKEKVVKPKFKQNSSKQLKISHEASITQYFLQYVQTLYRQLSLALTMFLLLPLFKANF